MNIKFSDNMNKRFFENMDLLVHSITKQEVVTQNIERISKCIEILRSNTKESYSKLMITFDGYDNDPKEIYEINEIRNYVSKIFSENNDLFYYITTIGQNNKLILACMSDIRQIKIRGSNIVNLEYKPNVLLKNQITQGILSCANGNIENTNKALENLFN